MCNRNTRRGVSRCTSNCDVDLFVFNFFGVWPVLHTSIVYGGRQWSRTHAFQQLLSIHAAVAAAMHASTINACAGVHTFNSVKRGSERVIGLRNTALAAAVATGRCTRKVFSSFCHMNVAGIAHVNSCLLYTSPSPRDATLSRMPSSA